MSTESRARAGPAVAPRAARQTSGLHRPRPVARHVRLLLGAVVLLAIATVVGAERRAAGPAALALWRGPASGGVWIRTGLTLQTNALLALPRPSGWLVAGTTDGVWRSADGGAEWTRLGAGLQGNTIFALAATPDGGALFAGSMDGTVYTLGGHGAASWRRASPPFLSPVASLAVSPGHDRMVLAGTVGALYRGVPSADGWRWQRVARTGEAMITSIAWSPANARLAWASLFGVTPPVLATRDGGRNWRAASAGLPALLPAQALLALTGGAARVILTTMGGGVWQLSAQGRWQDISAGLPERHAMPLVALPGAGTGTLYAGTMGDGVYVKQGGAPWRLLGRGLTGVANTVLTLGISDTPHLTLLAGTANGVFRYVAAK